MKLVKLCCRHMSNYKHRAIYGSGIKIGKGSTIEVDQQTLATTREGIFAAGDNVRGPATAVQAVADGKNAAFAIDRYLGGDGQPRSALYEELINMHVTYDETIYQQERARTAMPHLPIPKRHRNFNEVVLGYHEKMAIEEAKRCLHCYLREEEEEIVEEEQQG